MPVCFRCFDIYNRGCNRLRNVPKRFSFVAYWALTATVTHECDRYRVGFSREAIRQQGELPLTTP